jgi:putative serine protease PepD
MTDHDGDLAAPEVPEDPPGAGEPSKVPRPRTKADSPDALPGDLTGDLTGDLDPASAGLGPRPPAPRGPWWSDVPSPSPPPSLPAPQPRPLHRLPTPPRPQAARLPWPIVLLMAVVTGLVGGVVGALSVDGSAESGAGAEPSVLSDVVPAPLPNGGSVAGVANAALPSVVQITADGGGLEATGSGFVLDHGGHVLTNNHVVSEVSESGGIVVVFDDESRVPATVVGSSPAYDVAVLKLARSTQARPAARADLAQPRVGDTVIAIGAPLGLSSTVTSGIVSALDRPVTVGGEGEVSYINAIQTDAAINPGNSGGPLVNLRGEVIGVNSAIATLGSPFGGGSGSIGVGFAIPIDQVLRTADQILQSGEASYPVIGASVDVTSEDASGARIMGVVAGGPAEEAGLQDDDVVTSIDGDVVDDGIELIVAIRSRVPGDVVTLEYRRDGDVASADVRLDEEVG